MDDACTNAGIVIQTTLQARAWAIESHSSVSKIPQTHADLTVQDGSVGWRCKSVESAAVW